MQFLLVVILCFSAIGSHAEEGDSNIFLSTFDTTGLLVLGTSAVAWEFIRQDDERQQKSIWRRADRVPSWILDTFDDVFYPPENIVAIGLLEMLVDVDAGRAMIEGALLTGVTVEVLKNSYPRKRPNGAPRSFPSGHTAMAFVFGTNIAYFFGPYWGAASLILSAGAGYQRHVDEKHYLSDVFAGAVIGFLWARGAATRKVSGDYRWVPLFSQNTDTMSSELSGLSFVYDF